MRTHPSPRARLHNSSAQSTADLERNIVRALCHAKLSRATWIKITRALGEYTWRDVEHGLVYAAVDRLSAGSPKLLREQLPAQATRMGFPDIDWEPYFASGDKRSATPTKTRILQLIHQLRRTNSSTK
ncbi:MAG TPA: hypothetical protein VMD77_07220 [Candidatus Baltobacteraceae bacterium]|nr:hypothetical protein [Candidatus Baltobacteraceae bacterium]